MNKLLASIAVLGISCMAFAGNPWQGAQTDVPVTVTVGAITELYTGTAPVALQITNSGTNGGEANAVSRTVTHLANVPIKAYVEINGDIANWTQFHILIKPVAGWTSLSTATAEKVISWRRDGAGYLGATEVPATNVNATGPNSPVEAFTGTATTASVSIPIQYFAQAPNGMPAKDDNANFTVIWTVAANP